MTTYLHTKFGVAMYGQEGPTGEFREATRLAWADYGGNLLEEFDPDDYRPGSWRIPVKLVAVETGQQIASADILCDY